jgi:GT2 family glycosyltransferase
VNNITDIIIPVHNEMHWLSFCLEELFRYNHKTLGRVIVVNDRSTEEQQTLLVRVAAQFKKIEVIHNNSNSGGFGYSCNLGASNSSAKFVIFLNTDCLITESTVDNLTAVLANDEQTVLACPISNNSPDLTYEIPSGFNYIDIAFFANKLFSNLPIKDRVRDACTVVGNCLVVRKIFFNQVGGFSEEWGIGYGEETDLHMKAVSQGHRGVVDMASYVYHFGGGTFNQAIGIEKHRENNYKLFMSRWANEYKKLAHKYSNRDVISNFHQTLQSELKQIHSEYDALFYLPGLDQGIGGLNAVVSLCNELIKNGLKANCILVGRDGEKKAKNYKDPLLFNPLYFFDDTDFLENRTIFTKIIFSTLYSTVNTVSTYAERTGATPIQFVQGYEPYFENGTAYQNAVNSYKGTTEIITTSEWLIKMVSRHLTDGQEVSKLPLIVNPYIFYPNDKEKIYDIAILLRGSQDKGQWLLLEIIDRLVKLKLKLIIFVSDAYYFSKKTYHDKTNIEFIDLPKGQCNIANLLRKSKVLVDMSLHEGFGLTPLEANMCGCKVILSDSGGPSEYCNTDNLTIVPISANPEHLVSRVISEIENGSCTSPQEQTSYSPFEVGLRWTLFIKSKIAQYQPSVCEGKKNGRVAFRKSNFSNVQNTQSKFLHVCLKIYRKYGRFIPLRIVIAIKVLLTGRL